MTMHPFKREELVILLGAGASVEAQIPNSIQMIRMIEERIAPEGDWAQHRSLYYFVRSAIEFGSRCRGPSTSDTPYNIETLVGTLDELGKRDQHALFPFIGAWSPKLQDVAGQDFCHVSELRAKILDILRKEWIPIKKSEQAAYYDGIPTLQKAYEFPLRVFTLNYDLCVEEACRRKLGAFPQRGFEGRTWDWRQFNESSSTNPVLLYKLHGSIDWRRESDGTLEFLDNSGSIKPEQIALIFGTTYKLQYVDPFLFLAYEFRRWTLESKLILSIGYGFGDEHINGILGQALKRDPRRIIVSVSPLSQGGDLDVAACKAEQCRIREALDIPDSRDKQIVCIRASAGAFMTDKLSIENLGSYLPADSGGVPF